jgi:high-affinity nickel-transport protein
MLSVLWNSLTYAAGSRRRVLVLFGSLLAANLAAWTLALLVLRGHPVLLGSAALAYTLGLRHAVDADHIAAIDNSVRKLMQSGQRPVGAGLYFSLGHALIVVLMSAAVGFAATQVTSRFEAMKAYGSIVSTAASAGFLLLLAAFNLVILVSVWRTFQAVKRGEAFCEDDFDLLLNSRGLLSRLFRPLFRMVSKSWHLFPIGFLFGLGFDTATEVALFGLSATQAADGVSPLALLVYPALFTAGMTLIDTLDGALMLGAYGWAFLKPVRKLYYNLTISAVSVIVALLIGGVETLGLIGEGLSLEGPFWDEVGAINGSFGLLGYGIIAIFVFSWIVSAAIYRLRGYDALDVRL